MDYNLGQFKANFQMLQKILESNILLYCAVLILILKIAVVGVSFNVPFNVFFADITKSALENYANQARQSAGVGALKNSIKLDEAAKMKAEDMIKNQYFSHTSPNGITPWFWFIKSGYSYKYAGENLAIGFFNSNEVYGAWMDSALHRDNLLNKNYTEIGTAVAEGYGNNNAIVVVQLFGTEKSPVTEHTTKKEPEAKQKITPQSVQSEPDKNVTLEEDAGAQKKVLAQTTEDVIGPAGQGIANDIYSKLMSFAVYNRVEIVQNIIFGVSLVVIGMVMTMIFASSNFVIGRNLVFRSVVVLILLACSALANEEVLALIIPHQILI